MRPCRIPLKTAHLCGLILLCVLAACERKPDAAMAPLTSEVETFERLAPGCKNAGKSTEECTSVEIKREVYAGRPALNEAVLNQLLQQLQGNGESDGRAGERSLQQVAEEFIAEAAEVADISSAHWQLSGEAKTLAQRGQLLTVDISSYYFSGGAHGMPATHWLNWDLAADKPVKLDDVIAPGQQDAFWKIAETAHQQWLDSQEVDESFRDNWPFARTEDFRLSDEGLVLLYGVYVLAPYSSGQVELTLPREELTGVLRAPYLSVK